MNSDKGFLILPLDDKRWSEFEYLRENHREFVSWLGRFREESLTKQSELISETDWSFIELLCHQWSITDASFAAVPHLIDICRILPADSQRRIQLLIWIGWCVSCTRLPHESIPVDLIESCEAASKLGGDLLAASLPYLPPDQPGLFNLRNALAALATFHGNSPLAFVLFELEEGGARCESCGKFFQPMKSSLNPFWNAEIE